MRKGLVSGGRSRTPISCRYSRVLSRLFVSLNIESPLTGHNTCVTSETDFWARFDNMRGQEIDFLASTM